MKCVINMKSEHSGNHMGILLRTILGIFWLLVFQERWQYLIGDDFRKQNAMLVQPEYPLPAIDNAIKSIMEFHYGTVLDLNMGYLSLPLDEPSKVIITSIMPFWLFECQVLPQGVKPASDIFQGQTTLLFQK